MAKCCTDSKPQVSNPTTSKSANSILTASKPTGSVLNRLRRIEGQIRGIEKMVREDRYCIDVLTQTSAVISALHGVEDLVMGNHLNRCVSQAMSSDDESETRRKVDELLMIVGKMRRQ